MFKLDELKAKVKSHLRCECGQTMSEYALVVMMMVSSATVFLSPGLGSSIGNAITSVARLAP